MGRAGNLCSSRQGMHDLTRRAVGTDHDDDEDWRRYKSADPVMVLVRRTVMPVGEASNTDLTSLQQGISHD